MTNEQAGKLYRRASSLFAASLLVAVVSYCATWGMEPRAAAAPAGLPSAPVGGMNTPPKVGEVRTFAGIEMVWIPPGTFMMGTPESQARGFRGTENAVHQVTLTRGFWIAKYEATNAQFQAFVNETGYWTDAERKGWAHGYGPYGPRPGWEQTGMCWRNPGWAIEDRQPVVCITWNDAHAYLDWLNRKGQGIFRLPTSARWEYACRAGSTTFFPWGDRAGKIYFNGADQAWKTRFPDADLAPGLPWNDGYALVAPVGKFRPNAWGLYDMIGNVQEWCEDSLGQFTGKPLVDPSGFDAPLPAFLAPYAMNRVVRYGSFRFHPYRSAFYGFNPPDEAIFDRGFRVCREE